MNDVFSDSSDEKLRRLGSHERLLYQYSKVHHFHFCVVGEVVGNISSAEFVTAVRKAQIRHPNLQLTVTDDKLGPYFSAGTKSIDVTEVFEDAETTWQSEVGKQLSIGFPAGGLLLRVNRLIKTVSEVSFIVLTFHHAIADGLSAVAFLKSIVDALNGVVLSRPSASPCAEDLLPVVDVDQKLLTADTLPRKEDLLERARQSLWRPFGDDRAHVESMQLNETKTLALRDRCRLEATTVHGAICAAVSFANAHMSPTGPYRILSPINIRPTIEIAESEVGVFFSSTSVWVPQNDCAFFWERARTISREVQHWRSADKVVLGARILDHLFPHDATVDLACGLFGWLSYDALVSNLGVVDGSGQSGSAARLVSVRGPMILSRIRDERTIGAVTFADKLSITETIPAHMPSGLKRTIAILDWAAAGGTTGCQRSI